MTVHRYQLASSLLAVCLVASCASPSPAPIDDGGQTGDIPSIAYNWSFATASDNFYHSASELVTLKDSLSQPAPGLLVSGTDTLTVLTYEAGGLYQQNEMDWHSVFGWFGVGEVAGRLYVQVDNGVAELAKDDGFPLDNPPRDVDDARLFYASFAEDAAGYPVAVWDDYPGRLHFARTEGPLSDPVWGQGQTVFNLQPGESDIDKGSAGHLITLANGRLLITYAGVGGLTTIHSLDQFGDAWGEPQLIAPLGTGITLQRGTVEHLMIDGKPELIFYGGPLYFMRALDENATQWTEPRALVAGVTTTEFSRAALIELQGRPVVAYEMQGINLMQANDPLGTKWGDPQTVDPEGYGRISMKVIGGKLVVSYMTGEWYDAKPRLALAQLDR
jgi:hypothetical protein